MSAILISIKYFNLIKITNLNNQNEETEFSIYCYTWTR